MKKSVAYVIRGKVPSTVLVVQRASNDDSLPNVWGLPAGSLRNDETYEDAVIRSGKQKLGIDLEIVQMIAEGETDRGNYVLHMREYEAKIISGEPSVPQSDKSVSQYADWTWGEPELLKEAARKGSLCSRLYLSSIGADW